MLIENVFGDKNVMEALLQEREIYWQHTLMILEPYGLNKRDELYVKRKYFPEYQFSLMFTLLINLEEAEGFLLAIS